MIWGLTLEPGKIYTRVMGDEIQLSMASLESRTDYGDESDNYSHVVMKTTKSEYLLCTLVHGLTFQQNLDLKLRPKETVTFSVQGSNVVYLMGYSVTDSEVEDQIDIEEVEEDSMNEMVEFEEGVIVEGESPTGHSGPNEDEDNIAMAEVEMNRHRNQLESRDMNPPSTSRDVQIEIDRLDEFSSEESPSINVIKVEETEIKQETEGDVNQRIIDEEDSLEELEDIVPTGIQRHPTIQGHGMDPHPTAGPHSRWGNASFETHQPDLQPVVPELALGSSSQTGDGNVISNARTVSTCKHETSQKTNPSTTQRIRNQPSADACSFTRNQTNHQGNAIQDPSKPYLLFCPVCRIATRHARQLQVHLRSHTGEKPFKCSLCEKSFSQVQNRDRHERTHTGARPFHCRFCNKTYTQNHHRKKHEAKSHGGL